MSLNHKVLLNVYILVHTSTTILHKKTENNFFKIFTCDCVPPPCGWVPPPPPCIPWVRYEPGQRKKDGRIITFGTEGEKQC